MNDRVSAAVIAAVNESVSLYGDYDVKPESTLDELKIDSLDVIEVIMRIEEDLRIYMDEGKVAYAITVQDLIDITSASYREARP